MPARIAGIQASHDASGHIYVDLGRGGPCRDDDYCNVYETHKSRGIVFHPNQIFEGDLEGHENSSIIFQLRALRVLRGAMCLFVLLAAPSPQRRHRFYIKLEVESLLANHHAVVDPRRFQRHVTRTDIGEHPLRRAL
jgi:hypothetical protein